MVQPAPLITNAPTPKIPNIPAVALNVAPCIMAPISIDQLQGKYNSHVPTGFSSLISSAYGIHFLGSRDTNGPSPSNLSFLATSNSFDVNTGADSFEEGEEEEEEEDVYLLLLLPMIPATVTRPLPRIDLPSKILFLCQINIS
ncbi:EC1118_1N18_0881p [Saccharomyces cerevisiae EC1118]|uniref:EC1118_1N18_0881p n=1 Tax=Saccharomyces cerevisiae (strain Lalvin EC1118 / Prise de mousse) TaxID=643680 RepID=C8ZFS1_YEAS8|nr:EC1118_1N18_0881p [Saccharomyces cerevisiae EC1118]